jgi:hypothetical protein
VFITTGPITKLFKGDFFFALIPVSFLDFFWRQRA